MIETLTTSFIKTFLSFFTLEFLGTIMFLIILYQIIKRLINSIIRDIELISKLRDKALFNIREDDNKHDLF